MSPDYGVCLARTDWDGPKHKGLTWFKMPLHAAIPPGPQRLAPDLVELAKRRGLTADRSTRQIIARTHINDYMQAQLTERLTEATATGAADATAASLINLGMGISTPLRAAAAIEITGRRGIAWAQGEPGEAASINFLNGRIMSIAGGSNQIQRNIIGERLPAA
jgi:alkylation response protein AidB-like acyl-CoA dehydrogenase